MLWEFFFLWAVAQVGEQCFGLFADENVVQVDKEHHSAHGEEQDYEFVRFKLMLRHVGVNSGLVCIYNGGVSLRGPWAVD
jgi:hypothetical protein